MTDDTSSPDGSSSRKLTRRTLLAAGLTLGTTGCLRAQVESSPSAGGDRTVHSQSSETLTQRAKQTQRGHPVALSTVWKAQVSRGIPTISPDGKTVVVAGQKGVTAIRSGDGTSQWQHQTGPVETRPATTSQRVYVPAADGTLYALNNTDGTLQWSFTGDRTLTTIPLISTEANRVVVGTGESDGVTVGDSSNSEFKPTYLYGLTRAGEEVWTIETANGDPVSSTTLHNERLYLRTVNQLEAYDIESGTQIDWEPNLGDGIWDRPSDRPAYNTKRLHSDSAGLYVPTRDGVVSVSHAGDFRWHFQPFDSPTRFAYHDNTVILGSRDNGVYAVDAGTGEQRWRTQLDDTVIAVEPHGETIWAVDRSETLTALTMASGNPTLSADLQRGYGVAAAAQGGGVITTTAEQTIGNSVTYE
ncbi:PQQ-binding-like beta-propeller repeat protein [Halobaculum limi]|uniref:outer membrane protein assembly factor BamB family protein n=1 Tax=Halobaculum limi TaxID=3031916 RepID=UPI003D8124DC